MRKIFLDTSVLIATCLSPNDTTASALLVALNGPYEIFVSQYVIDEYLEMPGRSKFRNKAQLMMKFWSDIKPLMHIAETPKDPVPEESLIVDEKDRPILRAALAIGADVFVTGDNHFLDARSQIDAIEIIRPFEFFDRVLRRD